MVKYAEGPFASVTTAIDASPEVVWRLVTDINLPAQFSGEFPGAEGLSSERGLGATFEGRNKHPTVGEWTTVATVTEFDEGSVFGWVVGDPADKVALWRFDLVPEGSGSQLRFSAEMGPGRSGLNTAIDAMPDREEDIVARRLETWETNMTNTVEGIKELAERE